MASEARPWGVVIRYGGAFLASALAVALRLALHSSWGSKATYSTMYPAVVLAALLAGMGPGLVATAVCTFAVWRLWLAGHLALSVADEEQIAFFALMGILVSVLAAVIHRARVRAERAAESERRARLARDEVLAVVAHDLKNPLAILSLQVELMDRNPRSREDLSRCTRVMRRSVDTMSRLIADLLDASAIEAGKLRLETREDDLAAVVDGVADAHRALAAERGVRLEVLRPPDPVMLACDPERIAQALRNLFGNALKFTPAGGLVRVALSRGATAVAIEVEDSGRGIEAERLPHVFDRYVHGGRASGGESGLGLTIAKGLVEAHGGRISVRSVPGSGTTFRVEIPSTAGAPGRPTAGDRRRAAESGAA